MSAEILSDRRRGGRTSILLTQRGPPVQVKPVETGRGSRFW